MKTPVTLITACWLTLAVLPGAEREFREVLQSFQWVGIPAGTYEMGNPAVEIDEWDEAPVHRVTVSRGFDLSRTEVTTAQFRAFRPDYRPPEPGNAYAVGVSWEEARAFCDWLSEKTGETYRLPTEAEWEWAARQSREAGATPGLPLENILSGPREWVRDAYGPYSETAQVDPVGREGNFSRVIRGGGDSRSALRARVTNRSSYGQKYSYFPYKVETRSVPLPDGVEAGLEGLTGNWFGRLNFTRPRGVENIQSLDQDWNKVANDWAGRYHGYLLVEESGRYQFQFESDYGGYLELRGVRLIEWSGGPGQQSAEIKLESGRIPLTVAYFHNYGESSYLRVRWKKPGETSFQPIEANVLRHTPELRFEGEDLWRAALGSFAPIGFRVVRAPHPESEPLPEAIPFVRKAVAQENPFLERGPAADRPYYRRRYLLPIPPDNVPREASRLAGFHPAIMDHNHSPSLAVMPNGDVLWIGYSSEREYEPETTMIATRLRFGADQWDLPEVLFNFAEANEHAPCLYTDWETGTVYFFWGTPSMEDAYPFQWVESSDSGKTWSSPQFPVFPHPVGPHSRQPISNPFRDASGTFYLPSDGRRQDSALWASRDGMKTWYDTGGRSAGRHTVYVPLKDGRIMAVGGKNTEVDGFQPVVYSSDGGKTWTEPEAIRLPALGSNQRPSLIRLRSGRLFYAGDFQHRTGRQPEGFTERGVLVALSEDEGKTWVYKKLPGALPHEKDGVDGTLGYSSAVQAPNGIIHVTSSMTTPCLHFEINEAWILDPKAGETPHAGVTKAALHRVEETYPNGTIRNLRRFAISNTGHPVFQGWQEYYYPDGSPEYLVQYDQGKRVGLENSYRESGYPLWSRMHDPEGSSRLIRYDEQGRMRSETHWSGHLAQGPARMWDGRGNLVSSLYFEQGRLKAEASEGDE